MGDIKSFLLIAVLGIPTANFSEDVVQSLPSEFETGIYFGFAKVEGGPVYDMVMSVGQALELYTLDQFYIKLRKSATFYVVLYDTDCNTRLIEIICGGLVGWNPYYKNEKKSMETHIMHKFEEDLYGRMLKYVNQPKWLMLQSGVIFRIN